MNSHATISEMMQGYADDAVRLAEKFGGRLDYSEASLTELERILTAIHAQQSVAPTAPSDNNGTQAQLDSTSRVWGAYFGETIRRLWGGEWVWRPTRERQRQSSPLIATEPRFFQ